MNFEYDDLEGTCAASPRTDPFKPAKPRTGKPIRVVLDLTTPLESITGGLAIAGLTGVILCTMLAVSDSGADAQKERMWALYCGVVFVLSTIAWWFSDCYYVMDGKQKKFLYHFSFMGLTWERQTASFSEIHEVAIDAWERYAKKSKYSGSYYWVYATVVVLKDGSRIRVSNDARAFGELGMEGRLAAEVVGCNFAMEGKSTGYNMFGSLFD